MKERWAFLVPALAYLAVAALLIAQRPGLQYEEATFQHGAVHLLTAPGQPPSGFMIQPGGWIPVGGVYWPLMIVAYVGALPYYIFAAPFALFGPLPLVARIVTALLTALGLLGVCRLLARGAGAGVALCTGLALLHPSFVVHTVFNKSSLAFWMGSLGALAFALTAYLDRPTRRRAFVFGLAAGLGTWTWLFFGVFLAVVAVAVVLVLGRRALPALPQAAAAAAGALLGLAPLLVYQARSAGGTVRVMSHFVTAEALGARVLIRLAMLGDTLVCDAEQRFLMWPGPPVPAAQAWLMVALAAGGIAAAALALGGGPRRDWHRVLALAAAGMLALLLLTPLSFSPHYFIALMPLLAATVVLAGARLAEALPLRLPLLVLGAAYAASVVLWDLRVCRGLNATGGRGDWSDAVAAVSRRLQEVPGGTAVNVLDWGLGNNLYVLSRGRIEPQELFWNATGQRDRNGLPWEDVLAAGGVFLTTSPGHRHMGAATEGFERALQASGQRYERVAFEGRDGHPYGALYTVEPKARPAR